MTIVAIDGPAGAGKSSVARAVARSLGAMYVDTGAMYRAIAFAVLESDIDPEDAAAVGDLVRELRVEAVNEVIKLNGIEVQDKIRSTTVTRAAAIVAQHPAVRDALVDLQRRMAHSRDVVMEGRDIGTRVFPNADVKIFLTASLEERARRRIGQLGMPNDQATLEEVKREIAQRDDSDRTRAESPLEQAADAVVVDTTHMTAEAVVDRIRAIVEAAARARERT